MRTVIILTALSACGQQPEPLIVEVPGETQVVTVTNTVTETNTITETVEVPVEVEQEDADGDLIPAAFDCDDLDPDVHPYAPEITDGVDNDCDGVIDNTACDLFVAPSGIETASKPTLQLVSNEVFSPYGSFSFLTAGELYAANGCGSGYTIDNVTLIVGNIPEHTPDTPMTGSVIIGNNAYNINGTCTPGTRRYCTIGNISEFIPPNQSGTYFWFRLEDMPDVIDHMLTITVTMTWTDLETGLSEQMLYHHYGDTVLVTFVP